MSQCNKCHHTVFAAPIPNSTVEMFRDAGLLRKQHPTPSGYSHRAGCCWPLERLSRDRPPGTDAPYAGQRPQSAPSTPHPRSIPTGHLLATGGWSAEPLRGADHEGTHLRGTWSSTKGLTAGGRCTELAIRHRERGPWRRGQGRQRKGDPGRGAVLPSEWSCRVREGRWLTAYVGATLGYQGCRRVL
jgi:hypothetical protein